MQRRQFHQVALATLAGELRPLLDSASRPPNQRSETRDWNQWGGPNQDFHVESISPGKVLNQPVLVWQKKIGKGHSAVVSTDDFLFTLHTDGNNEVLTKWHTNSGAKVWTCRYTVEFNSNGRYAGPHATPAIYRDQIFASSIDAKVRAIDLETGRINWTHDLCKTYGTRLPQSGYASSPVISCGRVVVPTIGESTSSETEKFNPDPQPGVDKRLIPGAVALDTVTGNSVWQTKSFRTSHCSAFKLTVNQQKMLLFHGMFQLIAVDPTSGKILWKQLLRKLAADNVSFTPIWDAQRNQIIVSHGYCDFGTQAIKLEQEGNAWKSRIAWTNSNLQIVHTNAVIIGDILIGTRRPAATLLVGIDVEDGKTKFRQRGFGKSNMLAVESQLLVLDEDGSVTCVELENNKVAERWKVSALSGTAWTVPSMVGDRLFLRDDRQIKVYRFL